MGGGILMNFGLCFHHHVEFHNFCTGKIHENSRWNHVEIMHWVFFFHHSGPTWGGPSNLLFCSCQEIGGCLTTVDGWNPAPVKVGSLSHYLLGFIHPQMVEDFFHQQYDQMFSSLSFVSPPSCLFNLHTRGAACNSIVFARSATPSRRN